MHVHARANARIQGVSLDARQFYHPEAQAQEELSVNEAQIELGKGIVAFP